MTPEENIKMMEAKYKRNLEIAKAKNADYCGKGEESDPFKNFKLVEQVGITSVEKGILVRMSDKLSRIATLLDKEAEVKDESIQDTLSDLCNYSMLLSNYIDSKK